MIASPDVLKSFELFLWQAFVICVLIGLLTLATLHLLRPLLRSLAQAITLTRNATLPERFYRAKADAPAADESPEIAWGSRTSAALVRSVAAAPSWLLGKESSGPPDGERAKPPGWESSQLDEKEAWTPRYWVRRGMQQVLLRIGRAPRWWATTFWLPRHPRYSRRLGFRTRAGFLPDDLFMRSLDSEAKAILAEPGQNPFLFALLTATAPDEARSVVAYLDSLAQLDPGRAAALADPDQLSPAPPAPGLPPAPELPPGPSKTAAGITAAESAVAAAADSWLDRFQLSLASQALLVNRAAALIAGVAFVLLAAGTINWQGDFELKLALGAAGGLFGLLADDAIAALPFGRGR